MLLSARKSLLLLVDLQERLVPAIHQGAAVVDNALWLAQVAQVLEVPVLASEQYPKGLGATVGVLREQLAAHCIVEKLHFSCAASPACRERIEAQDRRQVVIAGAEAHVCVLQSAVGLRERGYQVAVVAEGVGSRRPEDKALALERLRAEDVVVLCREMVAFEWLEEAGNDRFREVSKRFLR